MASTEPRSEIEPELLLPAGGTSPLHGFQGDRSRRPVGQLPGALSIAVSREAGARGGTIARRVGRKIGWQVFHQELLDYVAQEGAFRENLLASLHPDAPNWAEQRLETLRSENKVSGDPGVINLVRMILAVAAQGEVVLLGRGAGCVLPAEATLNVRIIAPLQDRIAYMAQWLRRTREEATEQVRQRDQSRTNFVEKHFQRQPGDVYQYDLVLNSVLLGEDICVDLIVQAARAKQAARLAALGG